MASTSTYKCKSCKADFIARTADRKRGWALFCSKSCKAKEQEKRTGQYANLLKSSTEYEFVEAWGEDHY